MKKFRNLFLAIVCIFTLFAVTGCGNKTSISSNDFKSKMENSGYEVHDATGQFSQYSEIKQVYVALDTKKNEQIEFYEFDTSDSANNFFNHNKTLFEESKTSVSSETNVSLANYSTYNLNTNGKYKLLSRIDNTVVYIDVNDSYSETAKKVLKDLGY